MRTLLPSPSKTFRSLSGVEVPTTYLDHAATTPVRPEAREAMLPWLGERVGNPSGSHRLARHARRALDDARDTLAEAVGCLPGEVVFTSGGTEADNTAILGSLRALKLNSPDHDPVAVCSAIEHHAVLDPVMASGGVIVGVDGRGVLDLGALAETLDRLGDDPQRTVAVVSVMAANNEIGTIQRIDQVAEIVGSHAPGAGLHTDAIQAFCWLDVAAATTDADLVSVSAHKFGGPQGVGALIVRGNTTIAPLLTGGGQERDRRSGTQNVAGIVAMAAAARVVLDTRKELVERVEAERDRLLDGLLAKVPDTTVTGVGPGDDRSHKVAGSAHVCFAEVESEELLFLLDQEGVCATAGSSCASGALDPSQVLAAIGVPPTLAHGSLRMSLGWSTTEADIDRALELIPPAVARLRGQA